MRDPIVTSHVYPPIPDRRFDWAAYRDPEGIQGEGPTEAAAITDFIEQEREQMDAQAGRVELERKLRAAQRATADFELYASGIIYCSVCTSLSDAAATDRLNRVNPTAISSQWKVSDEKTFKSGEANGCQCPDKATHRHLLFVC